MRSWREPSSSIMVTVASIGESRVWRTLVCPVDASIARVSLVRIANGEEAFVDEVVVMVGFLGS